LLDYKHRDDRVRREAAGGLTDLNRELACTDVPAPGV
jgi:hypothetical protein